MTKVSEYLVAKGWKPVKPDVHPQETKWTNGSITVDFIDAFLEQDRIDKSQENKS